MVNEERMGTPLVAAVSSDTDLAGILEGHVGRYIRLSWGRQGVNWGGVPLYATERSWN